MTWHCYGSVGSRPHVCPEAGAGKRACVPTGALHSSNPRWLAIKVSLRRHGVPCTGSAILAAAGNGQVNRDAGQHNASNEEGLQKLVAYLCIPLLTMHANTNCAAQDRLEA